MLVLHMFALCYASGFQTMGMFPLVGVNERNCDREAARFSREKRNIEIITILRFRYKRHIYVKIQYNIK